MYLSNYAASPQSLRCGSMVQSAELARCVGQLAAAHGWAAAELLWQPPAPVWLLPALLLQLSRHGVFSRRSGGGGGGSGGTVQLAEPEEAAAGRPLLLLPPRPVSAGRLARLAGRLQGAELLQPDSGQLLRLARHADSGPPVTVIGHCRGGEITPLPLPAPAPAGCRDLRVFNNTYRTAYIDWLYPNPISVPLFSLSGLARDVVALLKEAMFFHTTEAHVRENRMNRFLALLQNNSVDIVADYFGWTRERDPYMRLSLPLGQYDYGLFIRAPDPTSSPSFSGSLESQRLQVLAVCLLLLATAGAYITFRASGASDTRVSTFSLQSLGSFCSQGLELRPGTASQHIAAVVMLGVGMLAFQFYTAGLLA